MLQDVTALISLDMASASVTGDSYTGPDSIFLPTNLEANGITLPINAEDVIQALKLFRMTFVTVFLP